MTEVTETIQVEVAYALETKQLILPVTVPAGTTIFDAAVASGIDKKFPGLDLEASDMGIFGKGEKNPKQTSLRSGDRVEIYRPLIADPKEVRKKRAAQAKAKKA